MTDVTVVSSQKSQVWMFSLRQQSEDDGLKMFPACPRVLCAREELIKLTSRIVNKHWKCLMVNLK